MDIEQIVAGLKSDLGSIEKDLIAALYEPVVSFYTDTDGEQRGNGSFSCKYLGHFNGDMVPYYHSVDMLMTVVGDYKHYLYMMTDGDAQELSARIMACRKSILELPTVKFRTSKIAKKVYTKHYQYYLTLPAITKTRGMGDKLTKLYSEAP